MSADMSVKDFIFAYVVYGEDFKFEMTLHFAVTIHNFEVSMNYFVKDILPLELLKYKAG